MKGKLRVEFIKSLGFMFAIGDEYEHPNGTLKVELPYLLCLNSDVNKDWSDRFITHFAERQVVINGEFSEDLTNLPEDFPVIVVTHTGETHRALKKNINWYRGLTRPYVVSWTPDKYRLIRMQNEYDTEIDNKAISNDLDKIAESMMVLGRYQGENTTEESTSDSINWSDDAHEAQYALVGEGGEIILCEYHPKVEVYFGMEVYTYSGTCYKNGYYTLIEREEKEAVKLTSKDIDWEEGMKYAVVENDSVVVVKQFTCAPQYQNFMGNEVYDFECTMYDVVSHYIVKREEQSDNLIYTKEMKDNGELPKVGMKCVVNGIVYLCIGIDSRGHVVLEHPEEGGLIRLDRTSVYPVPTRQERIDKLKTDQRETVCKVLSNSTRGFLSPSYFDKGVKELQDSGLLCAVSDSNKS